MSQPWRREITRLHGETDPVPATPDVDAPWGVELADGQRCRVSTGAHASVNPSSDNDADVVDYYCGEELGLALLGGINTTRPVWTARAVRYVTDRYQHVDPQPIATAWF
jgi:hypothetical protein